MAHVGTPLAGSLTTSGNSATFTFNSAVSTGHTLIGTVNMTEFTVNPTITVSDTKGNTYTVDAEVTSATTDVVAVFSAPITVALTISDTLTVHTSDSPHTRWAISVEDFDDILSAPQDKTSTSTGVGTSMTSGITATTTAANELVFGGFGFTNPSTKTFTPGAGFINSAIQGTNAGSSDRGVCSEWQYVNSTGAQTATATLNASTTWGAIIVTYKSQSVANNPPTANAGSDQTVAAQQIVTLDGTGSSDSDGTVAAYSWTQLSGPTVTLSGTSATQPTFVAPASSVGATLIFGLTVTDNSGADSTQDTVTITVAAPVGHVATPVAGAAGGSLTASRAFTVAQTVVAGHYLVGSATVDFLTSMAQPAMAITDSKGNAYAIDNAIGVSSTVYMVTFSGRLTAALTTSDTITITDAANSHSRWLLSTEEFDNIFPGGTPLDQIVSNTARATAMTTTASSTTANANELIFASFGYGAPSAETFTADANYTASAQQATSVGTSDRAATNEWRFVNATATQTATGTISATANYGGLLTTYRCLSISGDTPPTANAGPDQAVTTGAPVTLNGSASSDPDGTIAGYTWRQISGTSVSLSSTTAQKPTFTAPGSTTTLVFGLVVTDNLGATSPEDTVTVLVGSHAGYVAEAVSGTKTTFSSSFTLTFSKSVSTGHTLLIGLATDVQNGSNDTFTATDSKGNTYTADAHTINGTTVQTTVFSAFITTTLTTSDTLTITNTTGNSARWAVSGSEFDNIAQNGKDVSATSTGHSVTLSAGPTATSQNQYEVIFGSFGFARNSSQTLSAGSGYALAAQMNTTQGTSDRTVGNVYRYFSAATPYTATASITAISNWAGAVVSYHATSLGNLTPTANAGQAQSVAPFAIVTLDGTGSTDSDGVISTYAWSQTGGATVSLSSASAAQPTFTAPGVDGGTTLTFSLTVTDNSGSPSSASIVTVTVSSATEFVAGSGMWQAAQVFDIQGGTWV